MVVVVKNMECVLRSKSRGGGVEVFHSTLRESTICNDFDIDQLHVRTLHKTGLQVPV